MNREQRDFFTIFNQRLAWYLMMNGFNLVAIHPNRKNPEYNVYKFCESQPLHDAIDKWQMIKLHTEE